MQTKKKQSKKKYDKTQNKIIILLSGHITNDLFASRSCKILLKANLHIKINIYNTAKQLLIGTKCC